MCVMRKSQVNIGNCHVVDLHEYGVCSDVIFFQLPFLFDSQQNKYITTNERREKVMKIILTRERKRSQKASSKE